MLKVIVCYMPGLDIDDLNNQYQYKYTKFILI